MSAPRFIQFQRLVRTEVAGIKSREITKTLEDSGKWVVRGVKRKPCKDKSRVYLIITAKKVRFGESKDD